jgi:uncharacterized protein YbjT (DUF2867 family)
MNVVLFGATGMVGKGLLLECLRDDEIKSVLVIGRQSTGLENPKLREILHADFFDFSAITSGLGDLDACFFCLGVSSFGMKEAEYRRITYDVTMAAARALLEASPGMTFEYISGQGTGGSGMWARVKGETENALLAMPFGATYMFRPGFIIPLDGIKSKTALYRFFYALLLPLSPLLERLAPRQVTDTRRLSRAMIRAAKIGSLKRILEMRDIARLSI